MLREIIDKFYLDRQRDKEQRHFYITDAGRCGRAIFFKFKNVPRKEMEANILRLFDHGDHIHQLIMKPLLSTRDIHVVASEVDIPPQEVISGRADAILSDGKELFVLDIKSMNSMIFRTLSEPKQENVDQLQLYLYYFRIPKGILLYVNKDNLELKEFLVEYNPTTAENLIANLTFLRNQINSDTVPSRLIDYPDNWQCRYCQYKEVCSIGTQDQMNWNIFKDNIQGVNSAEL